MTTTIQKIQQKIKRVHVQARAFFSDCAAYCDSQKGRSLAIFLILCISIAVSFLLGRLSMVERGTLGHDFSHRQPYIPGSITKTVHEGDIVASKKGTKYHYVWCPGALTISEKNKRWFTSVESARAAGLKPASNCPGLE